MSETNPKEVLRQARRLVESQYYDAALEKYIWFHDHALDADRSLVGVRLSYAISEWVDLERSILPLGEHLKARGTQKLNPDARHL
jgi:hypothetical protein